MSPLLYRNTLLVGITRDTNGDNEIMNTSIDKTSKPTNGINEQTGNPGKEITKMNNMNSTKQILEENVRFTKPVSPEAVAKLGWTLTDDASVEWRSVDRKVLDTSLQSTPYTCGEDEYVVTTTNKADVTHIRDHYAAQGLDMDDFSTTETDGKTHVMAINRGDHMMAKHRRDTIYEMWLGEDGPDDEDAEGTGVPVQHDGTTRADYESDAAAAITACKREQHGCIGLREDSGGKYYDIYENTRLPKVDDPMCVHYGDTAQWWATDRIADADGPLPGNNWRVVVYGYEDLGKGNKHVCWTSDQIVPTGVNLVEKVDKYLEATGDFHGWLEMIRINHTERTLAVSLGS